MDQTSSVTFKVYARMADGTIAGFEVVPADGTWEGALKDVLIQEGVKSAVVRIK